MKTKFNGILTLLLALMVQFTFAQERTISGVVSDDLGPVSDITVKVKGTDKGTVTDFDGNYSVKAKTGDIIEFTHISYSSVEKIVGTSNKIDVTMGSSGVGLDEVIVTAQGIKREAKALGYAITKVEGKEIEDKSISDVSRILSGKASGVQITSQGGTSGSATNVVIRGYSSINGNNQALFVVDGVPFSNDNNTTGDFANGNVGTSRAIDLDPNNIESVNVLKGLAAATLYGSAGRNGVVLITTKTGSAGKKLKKNEVTVSQSFFINQIGSMPNFQNEFGNGFGQQFGWFFSNFGPAFRPDGVDGFANDPLIDADGTVPHPYGTSAFLNTFLLGNNILNEQFTGQRYEYKAYKSAENFFRSGQISNTSLNFNGISDDGKINYVVNVGHNDDKGFTEGNSLTRTNFSLGGNAKLDNKFTVKATLNYALTNFKSPPIGASLGNGTQAFSTFANIFFTPRSVDLLGLPFEIPETGGSIYYRNSNDIINPRWTVKNAGSKQITNRFFGTSSLVYDVNDKVSLTYRVGLDFYNENLNQFSNKGGVQFNRAILGQLTTADSKNTVWDHYLALNTNFSVNDDISITFISGATSRSTEFTRQGLRSDNQIQFGTLKHYNFTDQATTFAGSNLDIQTERKQNIIGAFGEIGFDYKNYAYLTLSARNDWVSNLTSSNRSQFYPSISGSFIPTSAFSNLKSKSGKGLNYLKLRAGLGQSAGFPTDYPTLSTVAQSATANGGTIGPITSNSISNILANPDLKPELFSEFEVGFDTRIWNNRINLGFSYYDRTTKDQIIDRPLPATSGYTSTKANIGKVEGSGVEIDFGITIFKSEDSKGFNWNSSINFTSSEQIVTELGADQIVYAGFSNIGNAAMVGQQLGVIVGSQIGRDVNGNALINSVGNYVEQNEIILENGASVLPVIGDPNPDYVMNFNNTFTYKNFNLGFQVNHTKGGDMYSSTIATLLGRGSIGTDRKQTFILPGVSNTTGQPNNIQIVNSSFYFDNLLFGPNELRIIDASVVRLQEVSLGYSIPKKLLDRTPLGNLSFKFSGYNLWYNAYNTPSDANFDPNVSGTGVGNGRGFDFMNGPGTKRFGLSVKATF